jgi:hypothetical protein
MNDKHIDPVTDVPTFKTQQVVYLNEGTGEEYLVTGIWKNARGGNAYSLTDRDGNLVLAENASQAWFATDDLYGIDALEMREVVGKLSWWNEHTKDIPSGEISPVYKIMIRALSSEFRRRARDAKAVKSPRRKATEVQR